MATTFDLMATALNMGARASMGFDDDDTMAAFDAELSALGETGADKALARRHVAAGMRAQANGIRETALRLLDKCKRIEADADRIDEGTLALVSALQEAMGTDRVKTPDGGWAKAAVRKSETVEVNVDLITDDWCRFKREVDRAKIKEAIKSGVEVPGAWLEAHENIGLAWSK